MSSPNASAPRRKFLSVFARSGAAAVGIMALPAALSERFIRSAHGTEIERVYPRQRLTALAALDERAPLSFNYPDAIHPCVLLKLGAPARDGVGPDGDVVAFSTICPHLGCPITYHHDPEAPSASAIPATMMGPCPCHFSCFDLSARGYQVQGQATESLPQVLLEVVDGEAYAIGMRGLIYGRNDNLVG